MPKSIYSEENCPWCLEGSYDGQRVMLTNHGWVDIRYCPECGRKINLAKPKNMDKKCEDCKNGELHGFPPEGASKGWVGTISFWCPVKKHHNARRMVCEKFEEGKPKEIHDDIDW